MIPIYIISFNNGYYVNNTVQQLKKLDISLKRIYILDNNTTSLDSLRTLRNLEAEGCHVFFFNNNRGHLVWQQHDVWQTLPEYFIITDPDLQFNENLRMDFIDRLKDVADRYEAERVGFALSLEGDMYTETYCQNRNIKDWESQFWQYPIEDNLYNAGIDTTFFLGKKSNFGGKQIRISGDFTAKHLPWYPEHNAALGIRRLKEMYGFDTGISTTGKLILSRIREINKRGKLFSVELDKSSRDIFWLSYYSNWENDTFDIFDKFVKRDSTVIDIGAWIGPTVLYSASLGAKVIAVEADKAAIKSLKNNILLNEFDVKVIEKAIYKDDHGVYFGENLFRNDGMNASTSQIVSVDSSKEKYVIDSITFSQLVKDVENVCLIKVDIEGGEEHILKEVLEYALLHSVPAYISFHLTWWSVEGKNSFKDFENLFSKFGHSINFIIENPFESLLFVKI